MKIGAGRFYKTRGGETVGPMWLEAPGQWRASDLAFPAWHDDGPVMTGDVDNDIVEEIAPTLACPFVGHSSVDIVESGALDAALAADARKIDTLVAEAKAKPPTTKASLLDAAKAAVADRGLNYGRPEDNFARIASLWNAHLANRASGPLAPTDVALMMALMKIARLENDPSHLDSWTDLAGYAACGAEISA